MPPGVRIVSARTAARSLRPDPGAARAPCELMHVGIAFIRQASSSGPLLHPGLLFGEVQAPYNLITGGSQGSSG